MNTNPQMMTPDEHNAFPEGRFAPRSNAAAYEFSGEGPDSGKGAIPSSGAPGEAAPNPADGSGHAGGELIPPSGGPGPIDPRLPRLLMPGEAAELAECERIIEEGLSKAVGTWVAILTVRNKRLYRLTHDTFEDYMAERWGVSARQGYRLCDAAEVLAGLANVTEEDRLRTDFVMPAAESQVRPLRELPAGEWREAWIEALALAPNGRPTAKVVAMVVRKRKGLPPEEGSTGANRGNGEDSKSEVSRSYPDGAPYPGGAISKEERVREQADRTIAELRELLVLTGTADSIQAADLNLALEQVQCFRDHLEVLARRATRYEK